MFSKVMAISKKLDDLKKKEIDIENFYDPKSKGKSKKHHHFSDLNQDYKDDLNNYGFFFLIDKIKSINKFRFSKILVEV